MTVRPSIPSDIPAIVDLLKLSLGDSLMPKSEAYWHWKHNANPFGTSPVVVAFDGDLLVGVRAFMCWQWKSNGAVVDAVRAVDTATHPQHQGKGIFKKLTLQLLDQCKNEGRSFVFNTPNEQSRPGYLKMGWQVAGKFPVRVIPRLGSMITRKLFHAESHIPAMDDSVANSLRHAGLSALLQRVASENPRYIKTFHTPDSLKWRYLDVPVTHYFSRIITQGNDVKALAFYRFKQSKAGLEMRVTDAFSETDIFSRQLKSCLLSEARKNNASYITTSGMSPAGVFHGWLAPVLKIGPVVTIRELNAGHMDDLESFSNWRASIGDLELF